ncbi:MAG: ABC transporter ATP-binding protein [Azospirillaceae bacterium]|nr:ABC transporter ATP-binding protein [Azospirillaceae bacterium]
MSHAVIKVDDLTKCFGALVAVDRISFTVPAGSVTGLLGGNGAGKTTTLSMLLGLSLPTSGVIEILGHQMPRERSRILPRLNFSSPYVDLPHRLTVAENLTVYAHLYGLSGIAARIRDLAAELDINRFLTRPTGSLSAGQKSRVALAKALLNRPRVLLLDEPTASLDPDTADWVRTYLERYRDETGATILLASHNMDEVQRLCAQVLVMRSGRVVTRGTPADLLGRYGRDRLEDVFIDIARDRDGNADGTGRADAA